MARRKHTKKVHHRRRRSHVSGIGGAGEMILAVAGGVIVGKAVTKFAGTMLDPKILAGVQIAGGIFLPKMIKGVFGQGMGYGLIANGSGQLLSSLGILSGMGMDEPVYHLEMNGTDNLMAIAGTDNLNSVSGVSDLQAINGVDDELTMRTRQAMFG
jgi:hypothetical protein